MSTMPSKPSIVTVFLIVVMVVVVLMSGLAIYSTVSPRIAGVEKTTIWSTETVTKTSISTTTITETVVSTKTLTTAYTTTATTPITYTPPTTPPPTTPTETTPTTTPPSERVNLGDLDGYMGKTVTVSVYLDYIDYDSDLRMYVLYISDDTGSAVAIASSSIVREVIDPWIVGCGSKLDITGSVVYSEEYGVYVSATDIAIVETASPPIITVDQALEEEVGLIVVIQDVTVLNKTETRGGNWILYVTDNTGTIKVFIPSSVVRDMPEDIKQVIESGGPVNLAGYLDVYRGEKEVIIYTPNGVST